MPSPDPSVLTPRLAAIIAAVNALAITHAGAQVHYVDDDAPPGGDGHSWYSAFRDLQQALDAVDKGEPAWAEIRVAQGTYTPDRGTLDQDESFFATSAVTLIGGFAGLGAANPNERDTARFVSVLSGDLLRNDDGSPESRADNSRTILSLHDTTAVIDGFSVRSGHWRGVPDYAGGSAASIRTSNVAFIGCRISDCVVDGAVADGGAIACSNSNLTIHDCLFEGNRVNGTSRASGAAIYFGAGDIWITDSRFVDNAALSPVSAQGGAIDGTAFSVRLINSTFIGNRAVGVSSAGGGSALGGAAAVNANTLLVANCAFIENRAIGGSVAGAASGGGADFQGLVPAVVGCVFNRNITNATYARAGGLSLSGSQTNLANSTIAANAAISTGGGNGTGGVRTSVPPSNVSNIVNCLIWANADEDGRSFTAQIRSDSGWLQANYCCIEAWNGSLPGTHNFSADPLFRSPDDLRLLSASPCIDTGRANLRPQDRADLDFDGDTKEPLPLDAANLPRVVGPELDIGAFETQPCPADHNADNTVNSSDFFTFLTDFFTHHPRADFNADSTIDSRDFFAFLNAFFNGC